MWEIPEVETVDQFISQGGKISYPKGRKNSNYCKYCNTWNSIRGYHEMRYHYCRGEVVATRVLKYKRCQYCNHWIGEED